nr:helicase-related protein [Thiospirillum jenense]
MQCNSVDNTDSSPFYLPPIPAMPRIFDNINQDLLTALLETLRVGHSADLCVGYFNLRGWQPLGDVIEAWRGGDGQCCRVLIGMMAGAASDELRTALRQQMSAKPNKLQLDNATVKRDTQQMAAAFRDQLLFRAPTAADHATLQQLARQLTAGQVRIKLHLAYPLHAKLYLIHRHDANNPLTGFVGSSNLTVAGLQRQGELNLDVLEHDACRKLATWFEERWTDRSCVDISATLAQIIDESWAGARSVPPFHVYLKMAWLLSADVRAGLAEFHLPAPFATELFEFQQAAVKIAARYLNERGGVLLGDVVGLGKSLMATALVKLFENDHGWATLIICPKNLVGMWQKNYVDRYELNARVLSLSRVPRDLPERRYRLVLIDESHNLRNTDGKRRQALRDYITANDSYVILLSATPYNKNYQDLAAQLGLFIREDADVGMRPERLLAEMGGEAAFVAKHQCAVRSLAAFEKSDYPDDWRDLMRRYLVRRTRSFIMQHYAERESDGRAFLRFADGQKSYFPQRQPRNVTFDIRPDDPYAQLYAPEVVATLNQLHLPRYGLGKYLQPLPAHLTDEQQQITKNLTRAGTRLIGFCRTNLLKRLESAGAVFLQSLERHILRNFSVLHALEQGLDIPIGTQDAALLLDLDADFDTLAGDAAADAGAADDAVLDTDAAAQLTHTEAAYRTRAAQQDTHYRTQYRNRFRWLPAHLFTDQLAKDLLADARALLAVLARCGTWQATADAKLAKLHALVTVTHPTDKVLIFTQFADTAEYLAAELQTRGVAQVAVITGHRANATSLVQRFAPVANHQRAAVAAADEVRVLITTDVLSEGQNLQDCAIVVNYDLPWAIIRLIQRVGRVDRIGQRAAVICCYSFMPAAGVEALLQLRQRVLSRLRDNAEVVGSDEVFFDDAAQIQQWHDLYTESGRALEDVGTDDDVDLASYAYQIWHNATAADPSLVAKIEQLPEMAAATKSQPAHRPTADGVVLYLETPQGNELLARVDAHGRVISYSQLANLQAAACRADTTALALHPHHHALVTQGIAATVAEEQRSTGALGHVQGARRQAYERLKVYQKHHRQRRDLIPLLDEMLTILYRYPLTAHAKTTVKRQLRYRIGDEAFIALLIKLYQERRLCVISNTADQSDAPRLRCSLGIWAE